MSSCSKIIKMTLKNRNKVVWSEFKGHKHQPRVYNSTIFQYLLVSSTKIQCYIIADKYEGGPIFDLTEVIRLPHRFHRSV